MKKLNVGIFSFTCCEGCTVVFIELLNRKFFDYKKQMNIQNFRALKPNKKIGKMDLAIIEGAISRESEKLKLLKIRENAKNVMAIGSCAITGMPSSQRNEFSEEIKKQIRPLVKRLGQLEHILPLKSYIKVDIEVPGCPIDALALEKKIEKCLSGKNA